MLAAVWLLGAAGAFGSENPLDQRINMAVRDADPVETFRSFAKLVNAEPVVSPDLKGKVTVELKNVRVRTLLDAVCESIGCRWELSPGNPPKLRVSPVATQPAQRHIEPKEPLDLKVTDAKAREVLTVFAQILGAEPDIDPSIGGTVTFDLQNTPWDKALDTVCEQLRCEWRLSEGEKKVLRVSPRKR
jgi:type II secretory pathway component GspD/PulD (secretin)